MRYSTRITQNLADKKNLLIPASNVETDVKRF